MAPITMPTPATRWLETRQPRTLRRLTFAAVFLFIWGLDTHGSFAGSGDEPHYQMIAHSLVFDGDLDLANNYADRSNLVGAGSLEAGPHARVGAGGRLRPVHDIGLPLVFAPVFAAAYAAADASGERLPPRLMARARLTEPLVLRHLLSLAMAALTALMAVMLFDVARAMSLSHRQALGWTLLFTLSPPVLSHSFLFFTEIPAALIVVFCWRVLTGAGPLTRRGQLLTGALTGFLLILHARYIGLAAAMLALMLWRHGVVARGWRGIVWLIAPVIVFAVARTAVNAWFWGDLFTSPHTLPEAAVTPANPLEEVLVRVFGLLVDQEHGLLTYAPVYLLALPAWRLMRRTRPREWTDVTLLMAAYLVPVILPALNRHGWSGGWSPAARFLVPIAPLLIVMVFEYVRQLPRPTFAAPLTRRAFAGLLVALVAVQIALDLLYWSRPKLLWNDGTGTGALPAFLSTPGFDLAAWLPSWHQPTTYTWVISVVFVTAWLWRSGKSGRSGKVEK
jgi:hypothetical protein